MPSCPACSTPIHPTEILCRRCYASDLVVRWPKCQECHRYDVCPQSNYTLCQCCEDGKRVRQYNAALLIQDFVRDYLLKQEAATRIQALWRGHSSRRGFVPSPPMCFYCCEEVATMANEYTDHRDSCADCFWDLREEYRRDVYYQHIATLEKLIH